MQAIDGGRHDESDAICTGKTDGSGNVFLDRLMGATVETRPGGSAGLFGYRDAFGFDVPIAH